MKLSKCCSVVLMIGLFVGCITVSDAAKKRKVRYCGLDQLLECMMEPLWVFTAQHNGTGIPHLESDFENFCFNIHDVLPYCMKNFANRCMSPVTNELFMTVIAESFRSSMDKFCDRDGEIRKRFLRNSKCLIDQVKLAPEYRRECVRNLQASTEWWNVKVSKKQYRLWENAQAICCVYHKWENCIVRQLHENCGQEAGTIITDLIYHGSGFLIPKLCDRTRYNEHSPSCECDYSEYEPPADFIPQGFKSNSIFSYVFSYSCPNVGWGIIDKRDF